MKQFDLKKSEKPHYYGKVEGIHVFHGTHDHHKTLVGHHLDNPNEQEFKTALVEAKKKNSPMVIIHGHPPESLRSRIHDDLGIFKPGKVKKSQTELNKAFLQNDGRTVTDQKVHNSALSTVPKSLMHWGTEKLASLPKDAIETLELDGKQIKVRKHDPDIYSGWIESKGNKLHGFERVTLPELLTQLQSKLELYGKEDEAVSNKKETVGLKLRELKSKISDKLKTGAFNETENDEKKEIEEFKGADENKRDEMTFDEINELEAQLKQFREEIHSKFGPFDDEHMESIPGSQIDPNPEPSCAECGSANPICKCYSQLPKPQIEFDFNTKKLSIFFKSESWDAESRTAFMEDMKRRAYSIIRKKYDK